MEQGGWRDLTSVMGYTHDVPERRRAHVDQMAVDTSFARSADAALKPFSVSKG